MSDAERQKLAEKMDKELEEHFRCAKFFFFLFFLGIFGIFCLCRPSEANLQLSCQPCWLPNKE